MGHTQHDFMIFHDFEVCGIIDMIFHYFRPFGMIIRN